MIPLNGTATLTFEREDGNELFDCRVLAANDKGDLLVIPTWLSDQKPWWVSDLDGAPIIQSVDLTPTEAPAEPGRFARALRRVFGQPQPGVAG